MGKKQNTGLKLTAAQRAQRAKMAEKARAQWADPNSKLRTRRAELRETASATAREQVRKQWDDPRGALRAAHAAKRIKPPKDAVERIEHCVSNYGSTKEMLASHFGISVDTFDRWLLDHEDIRRAFERSKGIEHSKLIGVLYDQAIRGNTTAAIVLLKFRHNYRDSGPIADEIKDPATMAAKIRSLLQDMSRMDGY